MENDKVLSAPKALLIKSEGFGDGSGFFVKEDLIVTNIHVVAGATSVSAKLVITNAVYTVEGVVAFDPKNDLVVLKTKNKGIPLPIGDSDLLQRGDIIQATGYPNGKYEITKGPIHSIRDSDKWIQMKFKTDSGNSGGPILNSNDEVIGIVVGDTDCYGYAVPANAVKMLLAQECRIEPLAQWQSRKQIRAYACMVRSQSKHSKSPYSEVINNLDEAIQLYPDYFLFYDNRGGTHRAVGQSKVEKGDLTGAYQHYQDAIADHTEAIRLCPDYAAAYDNRGLVKSDLGKSKIKEGNLTEAQQHFRDVIADHTEAIRLCPDYAAAYNNRADVKCHFGKSEDATRNIKAARNLYQEAIIDINTAIKLDSSVALFYHTRGEIRHALGDYKAAIEDYGRAREIDPNYTDVCKDLELAKKALEQQNIL